MKLKDKAKELEEAAGLLICHLPCFALFAKICS